MLGIPSLSFLQFRLDRPRCSGPGSRAWCTARRPELGLFGRLQAIIRGEGPVVNLFEFESPHFFWYIMWAVSSALRHPMGLRLVCWRTCGKKNRGCVTQCIGEDQKLRGLKGGIPSGYALGSCHTPSIPETGVLRVSGPDNRASSTWSYI